MACCKPCCGCADCTEGQQGKCCCGGSSGTCCQEGEYCCSGVCQSTPCGTPCDANDDCGAGEICCDNGYCGSEYCHYSAEVVWSGAGEGDACPGGFAEAGLTGGGKRICRICATSGGPCDEQDWWSGVDPGGDWSLDPNTLGVTSNCESAYCAGLCDPNYAGSCCPGCECVSDGNGGYECVAEEPPP